jgi:hypothetical protein
MDVLIKRLVPGDLCGLWREKPVEMIIGLQNFRHFDGPILYQARRPNIPYLWRYLAVPFPNLESKRDPPLSVGV